MLCYAAVEVVSKALHAKFADSEIAALLAGLGPFRSGPKVCLKDGDDETLSVLATILPPSATRAPGSSGAARAPGQRQRRAASAVARMAVAAVAADLEDQLEDDEEERGAAARSVSDAEADSGSDADASAAAGPRCARSPCIMRAHTGGGPVTSFGCIS